MSYHGNSINSLISGLFELIISQHTPQAQNIAEALAGLELELIRGMAEVERMIKNE
jgi:hypothetical protein